MIRANDRTRRLGFQPLESRRLLAVIGLEQEAIYVLNRARHDPVAYQVEQQLPVDLAGIASRGPLAVNDSLIDSAGAKSTDMVFNNYFGHEGQDGLMANKLARDNGYPLPANLLDSDNNIESIAAGTDYTTPYEPLNALIIDQGLPTPFHRQQLFGMTEFWADNREIGIGFNNAESTNFNYYWTIHTANREQPTNYLTGVVYDDVNGDRRYNNGEGLPGVTITVGTTETTTNAAGGWSLPVANGEYNIVARGGSYLGVSTATATVNDDNVEVDFISGKASSDVSFSEQYARNIAAATDVDGEGDLTVLDALLVINFLERQNAGTGASFSKPVYLDASGDGEVTAADAFRVINAILRASQPDGELSVEGEANTPVPILTPTAFTVAASTSITNDTNTTESGRETQFARATESLTANTPEANIDYHTSRSRRAALGLPDNAAADQTIDNARNRQDDEPTDSVSAGQNIVDLALISERWNDRTFEIAN
tara:strand:- start:36053 stop:37507 length:1455 start_codon:yes stop_codon:yes gene_type:complete